jgi:hypothetical protein
MARIRPRYSSVAGAAQRKIQETLTMLRPVYALRVRAEKGVDEIRALRGWLKIGLRTFGLKVLEITPREEEIAMVDMREYGTKFVKPDYVRDGPIVTSIVNVFVGEQFGRPILELATGAQLNLNETNATALIKAWGHDSDDWIGQEIELSLGTYHDWKSDADKETVRVKALSPAKMTTGNSGAASRPPLPASRTASLADDLSDDVPF